MTRPSLQYGNGSGGAVSAMARLTMLAINGLRHSSGNAATGDGGGLTTAVGERSRAQHSRAIRQVSVAAGQ